MMNRYISKSSTTTYNIIDRQYTELGQLSCQLLLVYGNARIKIEHLKNKGIHVNQVMA